MADPQVEKAGAARGEEMALRLAEATDLLHHRGWPEDEIERENLSEKIDELAPGLLSALDHALTGNSGCIEPDEWQNDREAALARHAEYLGFHDPVTLSSLAEVRDRLDEELEARAESAGKDALISEGTAFLVLQAETDALREARGLVGDELNRLLGEDG